MNRTYRWLILLALFVAAMSAYAIGSAKSLGIVIVLGVMLELCFWFGLFSRNKKE